MKKLIFSLVLTLCVALCASAQKPAVTLKTSIYEGYGDTNAFTLVIGGTEDGYIDVDCGFGPVEYELSAAYYDMASQTVKGTIINCHVNEEGTVRIYCDDPARIEYFNGLGAFIRDIEFEHPEALTVLNLEHNELERLDLSRMTNLQALYVSDNPFNKEAFDIDVDMPELQILEIGMLENIRADFDFGHFPALVSLDAMSTHGLRACDTSKCPDLVRLSVDNTNVETVDTSRNPALRILNVSDTRVSSLDLSRNTYLQQLYASHYAAMNHDYKLAELDLSHNSELIYLFVAGNALTSLDCSGMSKLRELSAAHNQLRSLNIEGCDNLYNVSIQDNYLDFNTLPVDPGDWSEYVGWQHDLEVPRAVAVGEEIDLKSRVIRDDSPTHASVFSISRNTPYAGTPVSEELWKFDDGKLSFNAAIADSVYVEFYNPTFQDFTLQTARFKVKSAEEFGKPSLAFFFTPIYAGAGETITFGVGVEGATPQEPKRVHVDFGDGNLKVFEVKAFNGQVTTISATKPSYGSVRVYTEGDDVLTDIVVEDIYCSEVDLSRLEELRHLTLRNLELYDIDLQWNRCLQSLTLTGNHFYLGINLMGANGWYGKNVLTHIDLSNNEIAGVELVDVSMIKYLDLSNNKVETFNFTDAEALEYVNLSNNLLTDLVINYCSSLREGHFDNNQIKSVRMPETNVLEIFSISNNCLTLATLPERGNMAEENYTYAPQAKIAIPTKGPGHNLSSQLVTIDGQQTQFTWKTTDGATLEEGVDYTIADGNTTFLSPSIGKTLYCEISHPAFPAFSGTNVLRTTNITSAGMPTNVLATFLTPVGGQSVSLAMRATVEATPIYIDWSGDGSLKQYILSKDNYTRYDETTTAGAVVKVYSYSNVSNLSVFSMTGATLDYIDASGMKQLVNFSVNQAGLELDNIVFPRYGSIKELSLEYNRLTSFDLSPFTKLESFSLAGNRIKSIDLSKAASTLQIASIPNNGLEEITFGSQNKNLWGLYLSSNRLTEVDFHNVPALYQVFLNDNLLDHIDLSYLKELRVVSLDRNRFDFSNLPLQMPNWTVYTYGNQPMVSIVDGSTVDLSYLAEREGVKTVFRWYYDQPWFDDSTGELVGEELFEDDEYVIEDGVTTFLSDIDSASCVMTNELFPNLYLVTNVIQAHRSGVETVAATEGLTPTVSAEGLCVSVHSVADGAIVSLVSTDGRIVATTTAAESTATLRAPAPGLYIVATDGASAKVALR